ncbi:hypothetical protein NST83_06130 [Paenibacillus sp. FSL R10-2782]|uniref:hypothetical protein n=1 Tax=Paenibacillus sp. FSL R10-2782 TaxID=2954661 RepID=UPI0031580EDC
MSEQILNQILAELKSIKESQENTNKRLTKIEEQTKDIPLIKQAVLETLTITKQIDSSQSSFERKAATDLNTHEHSIDILNRRQLRLEADIEKLKNR